MIEKQHSMFAFELITSSFYLWSHNRDLILIPHLKKSFTLTTTQSTLIDFVVYMAYFLMVLPAGANTQLSGQELNWRGTCKWSNTGYLN